MLHLAIYCKSDECFQGVQWSKRNHLVRGNNMGLYSPGVNSQVVTVFFSTFFTLWDLWINTPHPTPPPKLHKINKM